MIEKRFASIFTTILIAASVAVAQEDRETISRSIDVGENGELSLSNISGDIHIEGTSGGQIIIEATKQLHGRSDRELLSEVEIDISHTGDRVRVETRYPSDHGNHRSRNRNRDRDHNHGRSGVSVDYRVRVPMGAEVEVSSVSGDVEVLRVNGETSVRSVSGDVRVSDAGNLVRATSVSGDVNVDTARSDDDMHIASVSGEVRVTDIEAEELDIESVSGDVDIDGVWCEEGEFDSVSGNISYRGRIAKGGRYQFKSHSGDVIITIGDDVGFELEAGTFSGDIDSEFEMSVSSGGRERRNVSAVVGDGSAVIKATTFSGDVELRRH